MSDRDPDRNTTIITTDSGSGALMGVLVGAVAVIVVLVVVFGWHPWAAREAGPAVHVTTPATVPGPAPAPPAPTSPKAPAAGG